MKCKVCRYNAIHSGYSHVDMHKGMKPCIKESCSHNDTVYSADFMLARILVVHGPGLILWLVQISSGASYISVQ